MAKLPFKMPIKFSYTGEYVINNTSVPSASELKILRINSLYDPDFSGTGE